MDYIFKNIKVNLENPLVVYPDVAKVFWVSEWIILQQVYYWLSHNHKAWKEKNIKDWRLWCFNSYKNWQETNFTRWSERTIKRLMGKLILSWVIIVWQFNKSWYDKTNWYTIDYDLFESYIEKWERIRYKELSKVAQQFIVTTCHNREWQVDPIDSDTMTQPIPETTKEIKKETTIINNNTPNGDELVEKENPIINNIAIKEETIDVKKQLENYFKSTEQAILEEPISDIDNIEKIITDIPKQKELTKQYWRSDINKICQEFQNLCEEYWLVYSNKDDRKAAKRLTWKPFWLKIAVTWCEDLFCYMKQIFEWNSTLWSYWYSIGWPAPFFYNAEKVYNKLKMSGKRESSTNPRFEEFYAIYPKREWYSEAKEWYSINVRKQEKHDEIMQWAKEFVKKVWKEQKDITFLPSANTYLVKERWYDTLPDKLQDDDVVYERAYESWDPEILREHLKLKYWEDFSKREELDHVCIYWQEKKTAIECKNQTPII